MFTKRILPGDSLESGAKHLEQCRREINHAKQIVASEIARDGQQAWDAATSWLELSKSLARELRGKHGIPQDASNAFFKWIELANVIGPYLRSCGPVIKMFDNACLPGDFIRAMQWWAEHRHGAPVEVDWRANSLVGGLDDRFGLLRDNPDRWMMGGDDEEDKEKEEKGMTGDVTVPYVQDAILHRLGDWRADIYTSDLGFAVKSHFHEEEEHWEAHNAQVRLGLRILRLGGAMVVKTFTMSTPATLGLISHLVATFDEFYVVKPETSKPDNSECYWVCLGYRGDQATVPVSYPSTLVTAAQLLARRQAQKISQNVLVFRRRRCRPERVRVNFSAVIKRWCALHIGVGTA